MKNFKKFTLIMMFAILMFSACKDKGPDEYVVTLTTDNKTTSTSSTVIGDGIVAWTVQVQSATTGKTNGLSGATVNVVGNDGTVLTKTTDANGFATFSDMRQGIATGIVTFTGYTTVNFSANLASGIPTNVEENIIRQANTKIMLWQLNAKLNGKIYGDFDSNGAASPDSLADLSSGIVVKLQFSAVQPSTNTGAGMIVESSIESNFFTATTDASGIFIFSNLPSNDKSSKLDATLSTHDFKKGNRYFKWTLGTTFIDDMLFPNEDKNAGSYRIF